ncbi:MAG TPA: hypothetical protein P5191_04345 [Ruminococcus sp.]|nr:hypothetical protein [Ruminococcus sp.]
MKILIVDDSVNKIKNIYKVLLAVNGIKEIDIEHCNDVMSAKAKLSSQRFDLLILDLNMPEYIAMDSSEQSGFSFIDDIIGSNMYNIPNDICILTEYSELKQEYKKNNYDYYFPIITYNETSQEWETRLTARVNYILKYHSSFFKEKANFDIALITAVNVETTAVKKSFDNWEKITLPNDPTIYYTTSIVKESGKVSIVLAEQSSMGMVAASTLATKIIMHFNPKYLIMPGIAAGIGDYHYGDIMFPKCVYDYSSGKYVKSQIEDNQDLIEFEPDPKYCSLDQRIFEKSKQDFSDVLYNIKKKYEGVKPSDDLRLIPGGTIACGSAVVANSKIVDELIKSHARKVTGLDMESYGVFFACECMNSTCKALCIKSVCDFANSEKCDDYQKYAAYTSASFVKFFIKNELEI